MFVKLICFDFASFNRIIHLFVHSRSVLQSPRSLLVDIPGTLLTDSRAVSTSEAAILEYPF